MSNTKLLKTAVNAVNTITAIYQWVDMVEKAGGVTSISGVAKANAMFASMNKERGRVNSLVIDPLLAEIEAAKTPAEGVTK